MKDSFFHETERYRGASDIVERDYWQIVLSNEDLDTRENVIKGSVVNNMWDFAM